MTFFNKKEEVIQLELTRVGREKLSKGQFIPDHYEFLDEDILYDRKNANSDTQEEQNEVKQRIKKKLSLRSLTAKQSVPIQTAVTKKENRLQESLGTFIPYSNYRPAWDVVAQDGEVFTGSGDVLFSAREVSNGLTVGPSYEKVPQLDLECSYNYNSYVKIDREDKEIKDIVKENIYIDMSDLLPREEDDSFILFEKDFNDFTITFEELNTLQEKDEYTLEVFQYEYTTVDGVEKVTVNPLFFDDEEENVDKQSVYWYFNLTTDKEADVAREGFTFVNEEVVIEGVEDECADV
tara:strand:+ start:26084 stop:26962 length:879 start_codon:yes stop_codon:yes gene_type:complete